MIIKAFAIRDVKAEAYSPPMFFPTKGKALQEFGDAANDSKSYVNKHPQDYVLFEIGTYDDATGRLEALDAPVSLGLGSDFIREAA